MGNRFVFTQHLVNVSAWLWLYLSIISAALCFALLVVIFIVGLHRPSRKFLDRVSFRIVCYSLIANTAFAIANSAGGSFTGPTPACGLAIWILQLSLQLSSMLNFCIALNMQLVIVHNIDGRRAEKYYILGCVILALAVTIPPYASHQYGWDLLVQECWYSNDNKRERLAWQIGTQLVWTGVAVVGEVISSTILLVFLGRHVMRRSRIVETTDTIVNRAKRSDGTQGRRRAGSIDKTLDHVRAYKGIILRIGLYPAVSCIINVTSIACVLHTSLTDGVHSEEDYSFLLLSDFLYGGRGLVYALLAATDPALIHALKTFAAHFICKRTRSPSDQAEKGSHCHGSTQQTSTIMQFAPASSAGTDVRDGDDVETATVAGPYAVADADRMRSVGSGWTDTNVSMGISVDSSDPLTEIEAASISSLDSDRVAFQKKI
ncbi:hypothetical protein OE88DRAFT_1666072 [Heliocybe sulcata]|uniref:G-protein coupled receptors family 2 profile 2 domain-containing protein n=1 Tax=Heliocybe sulcata TaxID=5364 RepID=A0A5C3N0T7_9AGAM|nr:hypothetical protein OE88DRAFT_1666072 [Heliocybe sulcata]